MDATEEGMVTVVSPVQLQKAPSLMDVTEEGMVGDGDGDETGAAVEGHGAMDVTPSLLKGTKSMHTREVSGRRSIGKN